MSNTEKQDLLDALYDLLMLTENERTYEVIGRTIDFIKNA
jgi:hypothetical protein